MDDPQLTVEELRAQIAALEQQIARLQTERARLIQGSFIDPKAGLEDAGRCLRAFSASWYL